MNTLTFLGGGVRPPQELSDFSRGGDPTPPAGFEHCWGGLTPHAALRVVGSGPSDPQFSSPRCARRVSWSVLLDRLNTSSHATERRSGFTPTRTPGGPAWPWSRPHSTLVPVTVMCVNPPKSFLTLLGEGVRPPQQVSNIARGGGQTPPRSFLTFLGGQGSSVFICTPPPRSDLRLLRTPVE